MRRAQPAFQNPPVPIVEDPDRVHKRKPYLSSAIYAPNTRVSRIDCRFCYDDIVQAVWKRLAVRESRKAMRQGEIFVKHVVPAVVRPARVLWNQFIGFLFLCFGIIFAFKTVNLALQYGKSAPIDGMGEFWRLLIAGGCTTIMLGFGAASFLRASRISRS